MTTPTVRETLDLVAAILELAPHYRIGQLIACIGELGDDEFNRGIWDLENEELHTVLATYLDNLRQRLKEPAVQEVA